MSGLSVYMDFLSQPSRAVILFVKVNGINHEVKQVSVMKGENRSEEYKTVVHPFGKVPAIIHDGFKVFESVAILRYIARKFDVPDHWYPKSVEGQAKVDEYLEWQHIGFRLPLATYFSNKVAKPLMGITVEEKELEDLRKKMENAMDEFEQVWMTNGDFITGDKISVADILALCEIDEYRAGDVDPVGGREKMEEWLKRVRAELNPHYEEVVTPLKKFAESLRK